MSLLHVILFVLSVSLTLAHPERSRRQVNECGPPIEPDEIHDAAIRASEFLMSEKSDITHGWPHTPAAIMGQQLFNPMWYNDNDMSAQLSVKQLDVELLEELSHRRSFVALNRIDFTRADFGGGQLAYYVLALQATCQDPLDYHRHDLIALLENMMLNDEFTNYFAYSLALLAQCHAGVDIDEKYITRLTDTLPDLNLQYPGDFDTLALSLIALKCVRPDSEEMKTVIVDGIGDLIEYERNRPDTSSSSVESSAIALQLLVLLEEELGIVEEEIPWCKWNLFRYLLSEQRDDGSYHGNAMSTSQILTVLARKTLMDVGGMTCYRSTEEESGGVRPDPSAPEISFELSIYDAVASEENPVVISNYVLTVQNGTTMFQVLQMLQEAGTGFSFEYSESAWGPYITSLMGVATASNTYWSLQQYPNIETNIGIGLLKPGAGEHYVLKHVTFENVFE